MAVISNDLMHITCVFVAWDGKSSNHHVMTILNHVCRLAIRENLPLHDTAMMDYSEPRVLIFHGAVLSLTCTRTSIPAS